MKKFLLSLVLMTFAGYMSAQSLSFKYEGNAVEPGTTIDIVSDINDSMEIQFDLHVINTTDADINVVLEMESDPSNPTQDYLCWGSCYMPGVLTANNTVVAGGEGIFNGHCQFVDADWNTLPVGSTAKVTYTFYDERNQDVKYSFVVNFKYETEGSETTTAALAFKYEGKAIEPGTTVDIVSDLNDAMELVIDLDVINTTDADINVVLEMESDPSNPTQDYFCWGTCYMPGVLTGSNTVNAGGEGIFNGHCGFYDTDWNALPVGSEAKITYTFYDGDNPDEKYSFVVNFKYEKPALTFKYENKAVEPGTTIDIVSDLNSSMELVIDLDVINTTDADINVVLEMESDPSNPTQDYFCWGTCYMPGVLSGSNIVKADSLAILNGHCGFYDADWNVLPVGSEAKITYTFYDERNQDVKYTFVVNFKYQPDAVEEINTIFSNAYPNPANNTVSFDYEMQNANSAAVAIYNMMGQEVVRQDLNLGGSRVDINVSDLNEGVYFYSLIVNNQTVKTNKFVVSR